MNVSLKAINAPQGFSSKGPTSGLCKLAEVKIRAREHFEVIYNNSDNVNNMVGYMFLQVGLEVARVSCGGRVHGRMTAWKSCLY
ncbi:hypothetical protein SLEP1_g22940 [Rubroshorea leprosula]|uniref:Uncharacterized protein n=1 Tax=Rubroshorea leprosula TaxID=152421 RepID=A0AAV5JDS8_9ROSI|nr:hypothetical protein SLEP1_g22940 [Rubroshorea leprosula]